MKIIRITELEERLILSTIRQRKSRINSSKLLSALSDFEGRVLEAKDEGVFNRDLLMNYNDFINFEYNQFSLDNLDINDFEKQQEEIELNNK